MIGPPVFAQLILLPNPQNPMLYNFFNRPESPDTSKSAPSHLVSNLHILMQYMFPGLIRLSIPKCTSIGSAVFAQLTADSSYTLQCALERY